MNASIGKRRKLGATTAAKRVKLWPGLSAGAILVLVMLASILLVACGGSETQGNQDVGTTGTSKLTAEVQPGNDPPVSGEKAKTSLPDDAQSSGSQRISPSGERIGESSAPGSCTCR